MVSRPKIKSSKCISIEECPQSGQHQLWSAIFRLEYQFFTKYIEMSYVEVIENLSIFLGISVFILRMDLEVD